VAEWVPASTAYGDWIAAVSPTGDDMCLAGAGTGNPSEPGALIRGGSAFGSPSGSGLFAIDGNAGPSTDNGTLGFRCAR